MFKINGTGSHFWLVEGILTPLLTLGNVAVMGKTFGRRATGHQWFEEFTISNGKVVLDVAASNGGRAQVKLGGKVVSSGKVSNPSHSRPPSRSSYSQPVCALGLRSSPQMV